MNDISTDAGKLELAVYNVLKPHIPEDVYLNTGARHKKINEEKMIYCNAPLQFYDLSAIGKTRMRVEIYVKDIGGFKDSLNLSLLREIVLPLMDGAFVDNHYMLEYTGEMVANDNAGYHFILMSFNVVSV